MKYDDVRDRIEAATKENYRRANEMIKNGMTKSQAWKVLSEEYDKILEERYLFQQSWGDGEIPNL